LPTVLQEYTKNKTGLDLDFSNDRFTIKDEDMVHRTGGEKAEG